MTIKKSLFAVATASTVAIAGTGIASAQDGSSDLSGSSLPSGSSGTSSLAEASSERDVFSSVTNADVLGSFTANGQIDYEDSLAALASIAGAAESIGTIAGAVSDVAGSYTDIVAASDAFQQTVADTQAYLVSIGVLPPA